MQFRKKVPLCRRTAVVLLFFGLAATACLPDGQPADDSASLRGTATLALTTPPPVPAGTLPVLFTPTSAPPYPADPFPTSTLPSTAADIQPYPAVTGTPTPTIAAPYPAASSTEPLPTAPPTTQPTPVPQPAEPLDRRSRDSVLRWLHYAFARSDLSVIEGFLDDPVQIGVVESEYFLTIPRVQFLQELAVRLPQTASCDGYKSVEGEISVLWIATSGWDPTWQFDTPVGPAADLVWVFNNQRSPQGNYMLEGIAAGQLADAPPCP